MQNFQQNLLMSDFLFDKVDLTDLTGEKNVISIIKFDNFILQGKLLKITHDSEIKELIILISHENLKNLLTQTKIDEISLQVSNDVIFSQKITKNFTKEISLEDENKFHLKLTFT